MIEATSTSTMVKNTSYIAALFLNLTPESYWILGAFMLVDTVTGVIRSGVVHGWNSVTSHDLTTGVLAKGVVLLVPLLISLAGKGVGLNLLLVAKGALNILIISELYSTLSNIQSIRLRQDVQEFDAVNYTLLRLRDLIEKTVKRTDITK